MSLEDIGSIEALLCCTPTSRTETTHHCALVMGQGVSVLVILASEAFDVVFASWNRALLGTLLLVREHVRLEVLDMSATGCDRA